jgi:2-dehydropantoate 2-reductase
MVVKINEPATLAPITLEIVGPGSVGLALAGRLSGVPEVSVRLRVRDAETADRLNRSGFVLSEGDTALRRRVAAVAPGTSGPPTEVLVVAVKCPQTAGAAAAHAAAVGPATLVVTVQNGLGADRVLSGVLGRPATVAVTRLAAHRTDDGVRLVSPGRTWVGPAPAGNEALRDRLIAALNAAGLPTEPADPIEPHVWRKLLVNAAINAPAALTGLRNGELAGRPELVALMRNVLAEALAVAAALGVPGLPPDPPAALAETLAVAEATAGNVCSMLADRRAGRPTEIDFINGALVQRAAEHGVSVPVNETLVRLIRAAR